MKVSEIEIDLCEWRETYGSRRRQDIVAPPAKAPFREGGRGRLVTEVFNTMPSRAKRFLKLRVYFSRFQGLSVRNSCMNDLERLISGRMENHI